MATCKTLLRCGVLLALASLIGLLLSCSGKRSDAPGIVTPENTIGTEVPVAPADGPDLVMLKDASGAPTGVKVYWWRVNEDDVSGYYLYRDTEPITEPDPSLRVNEGALIPQPDEGVPAVLFDDLFEAQVGMTYYYRVSAADLGWDESPLSTERSITISSFIIEGFSPLSGPVGTWVFITGEYFGEYNEETDAVYFTGVKNDKGPSALYAANIQADIISWESSRIEARVRLGTTVGPITVVSNNAPQQTARDFECTSPYILSVSPDPAMAGGEIDFFGANFGPPDGMNRLMIDDIPYGGRFSFWSDDHVVAILPVDTPEGLVKLELLIDSEFTNPYYCDILPSNAPFIQKVMPGYGVPGIPDEGSNVEIVGWNFGDIPNNVIVWFNGVEVFGADLTYLSDTVINLTVPVGASRIGEVHVIVDDGITALESNYYLYHTLPSTLTQFDEGIVAGWAVGEYSDVALGPDGEGFVVFTQSNETGGPSSLYLAYDDGGGLVIEELVSTYKEYRYPRVAMDTGGVVHFAYQVYGWDGEVRYGTWDNGSVTDELVYSEGSTDNPGAYLDMIVLDDGLGGIDRILVWSNELDEVMCGHMLDGASSWTMDIVYTADTAYNEAAGYYCSLDLVEAPIFAPPPLRAPSAIAGSYAVGVSFGLYSEDGGAHWEVRVAGSDDLDTWFADTVGSSIEPVTETVMRWNQSSVDPFILWSTGSAVNWSYYGEGWTTEEVTSGDGPYGAALGLYVDISGDEIAFGHNGGDEFFSAYFDYETWAWTVETTSTGDGRVAEHVGRGGAAAFISSDEAALSVYDPDMRDVALVNLEGISSGVTGTWHDIADGFATPGYDLSNRALVVDSNGYPHIVFGDVDPVTGERTLWMARPLDTGGGASPPSPFGGWEYDLIDSAVSGTLGHATMAVDAYDDFHIAYLKGSDVMYVNGGFGEFGTPQSVFAGGAITTAPRIALGLYSALDINIVAPEAGSPWRLWLIESENGMASHSQSLAMSCDSAITQYDLAVRHDGDVVVVAYLDSPDNELTIWEERSGLQHGYASTTGMNAGVTLTLDEDMHCCVTLADLESTGAGYMLHWHGPSNDYILEQFALDADASLTMSQWRGEYEPFISYLNEDFYMGEEWLTTCNAYVDSENGEAYVYEFYDEQRVPVLHSVDPYIYQEGSGMEVVKYRVGVFAYHADTENYRNVFVVVGPEWE